MSEAETDVASCSRTPQLPNRQEFEKSLSDYNDRISDVTEEIDKFFSEQDFEKLKNDMKSLRESREQVKRVLEFRKPTLIKLRTAISAKENQIMEMENDLAYKVEKTLKAHLYELEKTYNQRKFTSIREEQVLVSRLDKLKRNLNKLTKYKSAIEEKRLLTNDYNEEKRQQKLLFKDMRTISDKLTKIHQQIDFSKRRIGELKTTLKELLGLRRVLIEDYNSQKEAYSSWSKSKRKGLNNSNATVVPYDHSYPATFPLARNGQQCGHRSDEEEQLLEPFFEYKVACRRLIAYLESLQSQMEDPENSTSKEASVFSEKEKSSSEEDDSADDFPSSFKALKKNDLLNENLFDQSQPVEPLSVLPLLKRKGTKRSTKKPNQPINHRLEVVRLFADIDVEMPVCYQQVGRALDEVRLRLEACNEQTNIIMWDESDYQHMTVPSDNTCESNWNSSADMSEISSIGSFSLPSSPVPTFSSYAPNQSSGLSTSDAC